MNRVTESPDQLKKRAALELLGQGWNAADIEAATGHNLARCEFCGNPASLLCDGMPYQVLQCRPGAKRRHGLPTRDDYYQTCDRSFCRDCAAHVSTVFICSSDPKVSGPDSVDLCPNCLKLGLGRRYGYVR